MAESGSPPRVEPRRVLWLPVVVVVALQIPYPLVHGHARNVLTIATVLVFAFASVMHALVVDGWRSATILVVVAGAGGLCVEILGVHTGIPFGDYRYTGGLGPCVASVPVVIGAAWVMMTRPAACVARCTATSTPVRVAVGAIALASWDVFLDPQMVDAHHWRWASPSPHLPGIDDVPLSNFGGWLLVAVVLMLTLTLAAPGRAVSPRAADAPMVSLWLWTWASSTMAAAVFFHRPAVAAWGAAAMALPGVPLIRALVRR